MSSSELIERGYVTFRVVVDDKRGITVPIGVAAWDTERAWHAFRLLRPGETVSLLHVPTRRFIDIARSQVQKWIKESRVPYAQGKVAPDTSAFWLAISKILTTAVRVDPPRAMNRLGDLQVGFRSLFEAVVQPHESNRHTRQRIDGVVRRALGSWAEVLSPRAELVAFGGAKETVLRGVETQEGAVVVEGVNLAGTNARRDADALVSKLERIREGNPRRVSFIVGYCASPGGLNGETHMKDWIRERVTPDVFDLGTEQGALQARAANLLGVLGLSDLPEDHR